MGYQAFWTDRAGNVLEEVRFRPRDTRVSMNTDANNPLTAEMSVFEVPGWVRPGVHRVRLVRDGAAMGLYRVGTVGVDTQHGSKLSHLTLVDPVSVFAGMKLTEPLAIGKGENVLDRVVSLIEGAGETEIAVTPHSGTFPAPLVFPPADDTVLKIINELLAVIGYWGLRTDRDGRFVLRPYVLPADRPVAYRFISGADSLMVPEYSQEVDYLSTPNRFTIVCEAYGDEDVTYVGTAENTNPKSAFSFQSMGNIWIDESDTAEVASNSEAKAMAARRLVDLTGQNQYVDVSHAFIPSLWMDDRVHAETGAGDVFDVVIKEMSIPETGVISATWREVVGLE